MASRCMNPTPLGRGVLGIALVLVMLFHLMRGLRITTRIASYLALLGVLMRVLLPALHTHSHGHHDASSTHAAAATVCGCCAMHGFTSRVVHADAGSEGRDEVVESSAKVHHCTACEIEVGIPCGCPPSSDLIVESQHSSGCAVFRSVEVLVTSKIRLAQPRAPPSQRI